MLDHAGLFEKFLRILNGGFFHVKHVLYTCYRSKFRKLQEFSEIVLGIRHLLLQYPIPKS